MVSCQALAGRDLLQPLERWVSRADAESSMDFAAGHVGRLAVLAGGQPGRSPVAADIAGLAEAPVVGNLADGILPVVAAGNLAAG